MSSRNSRAVPLPPDERRAAILVAAVPLVRQHGLAVSTRQIASAADVAEGTLFRVFPNKKALLDAAVETALDPEPGVRRIAQIDAGKPLEDRLVEALELLRAGMESTWQLFAALRATQPPDQTPKPRPRSWEPITGALVGLFEPDQYRLNVTPRQAARVISAMLFATMPHLHTEDEKPFTPAEMVEIALHGIIRPPEGDTADNHGENDRSRQC